MLCGPVQLIIGLHKAQDRGDTLNYPKTICDALEGVLYPNDKQIKAAGIFDLGIDKANPRVIIMASELQQLDFYRLNEDIIRVDKPVSIPKKKVELISKNKCKNCGESMFLEKVFIGGSKMAVLICKNNHAVIDGVQK